MQRCFFFFFPDKQAVIVPSAPSVLRSRTSKGGLQRRDEADFKKKKKKKKKEKEEESGIGLAGCIFKTDAFKAVSTKWY